MKINGVENKYINPNFQAGKVRVFADFDKTFLPASHKDFKSKLDSQFVNFLKNYFKDFKTFLNRTKDELKFTITTGRTFGEFLTMAEISRNRGFQMPLPDSFIAKNGSDEYIKNGTDEDFYNGGDFPFKYDNVNAEKVENIKKLTNWDGPAIKEKLKTLFESYNLRIVNADSEHSPNDYGERSLFTNDKLPYETDKIFQGTDKADWVVGLRNDGNLKLFITYPFDMFKSDERRDAYKYFSDGIDKIFNELNIKNVVKKVVTNPKECGQRPWVSYAPKVIDNLGNSSETGLDKIYDVKEAIKLAKTNNDLVIAAGDSRNDAAMLNPGLYLKKPIDDPEQLILKLNTDPDVAKEFLELPFVSIVVKEHKSIDSFSEIIKHFSSGKYQKIIVVESGQLEKGIKDAIRLYSEQNQSYKEKLNKDLNEVIETKVKEEDKPQKEPENNKTDSEDKSNNPPNKNQDSESSNWWKYLLGAIGLGAVGGVIYSKNKKNKLPNSTKSA